jgi:hypothetical protein
MSFFARPNLDDVQFKQLTGSTLTLSGTTRIVSTGSLQFQSGSTYIPIVITGGTNYDVLTLVSGKLILQTPSSGASTGYYTCRTPSTVCVGGISVGTTLTGKTIACILEEMLVPLCNPSIIGPSSVFSITSPSASIFEIGYNLTANTCTTFSRGSVIPQYCGTSPYRSGIPHGYCYIDFNSTPYFSGSSALSLLYTFPVYSVCSGSKTAYGRVYYTSGHTVLNSTGGTYLPALPSGYTTGTTISKTVCGILPWYWGKKSTNNITCSDIATGTKGTLSIPASGTLPITYNSSPTDYLWFAVPNGTPVKTCWYVNGTNNGCIGGTGNLFATSCSQVVTSAQGCWAGCTYMVYVSCIPTGTAVGVPMCMY